jgi:hypothetical protein
VDAGLRDALGRQSDRAPLVAPSVSMIHLLILVVHLLAPIAKLVRPGGLRAVAAESLVLKHQLLISSRARRRTSNLNSFDRLLLGLGSLLCRQAESNAITQINRVIIRNENGSGAGERIAERIEKIAAQASEADQK